jgi:hypothetical protein
MSDPHCLPAVLFTIGHAGHGDASLGCFRPTRAHLFLQQTLQRNRLRMSFPSGPFRLLVPVTDIRLDGPDHVTPAPDVVRRVNERLKLGSDVLLSVGVSRAFKKSSHEPARHWLQVNNIHFPDDPCWQLG